MQLRKYSLSASKPRVPLMSNGRPQMASLYLNNVETELLRLLAEHGVKFIVVGGHAVQFHGHLRPAKDLDVFFSTEGDNPFKLQSALVAARVPVAQIPIASLSSPTAQVRIGGWHNTELLGYIVGVSFEEAYSGAISVSELNVNARVSVISLAHLIQNKRTLGRPQDLEDVAALERITNAA